LTQDKFDIVPVTSVCLRFIPTQMKFLATPLVAGNAVWSHMAGDAPQLWDGFPIKSCT